VSEWVSWVTCLYVCLSVCLCVLSLCQSIGACVWMHVPSSIWQACMSNGKYRISMSHVVMNTPPGRGQVSLYVMSGHRLEWTSTSLCVMNTPPGSQCTTPLCAIRTRIFSNSCTMYSALTVTNHQLLSYSCTWIYKVFQNNVVSNFLLFLTVKQFSVDEIIAESATGFLKHSVHIRAAEWNEMKCE